MLRFCWAGLENDSLELGRCVFLFRLLTDVQRVVLWGGGRELVYGLDVVVEVVDDVVLGGGGRDAFGGRGSNGMSSREKSGGGFGFGQGLGCILLQLLQLLGRHACPDFLQRDVLDPGRVAAVESLQEDVAHGISLDEGDDQTDGQGSEDDTQDDGGDPVVRVLERQTRYY